MIFKTESGSVYHVNYGKQQIRRVCGTHDPTPNQGEDGLWKTYRNLFLTLGRVAVIHWGPGKATITSLVTYMEKPCAILVVSCLLMAGCGTAITNKTIVEETHYCESNGMSAAIIQDWISPLAIAPTRVECYPKVQ